MKDLILSELFSRSSEEIEHYMNAFEFVRGKNSIPDNHNAYVSMELGSKQYGEVRQIIDLMSKDILKCYCRVFNIEINELLKKKVTEFIPANNWLKGQIKTIVRNENQRLAGKPDSKWVMAGGDRLEIFGSLNVLIPIAEKFNVSPESVAMWSYNFVFALQYRHLIYSEVVEEYQKLNTPK